MTSSAARGVPPTTRASQTRLSTVRVPGPSPYGTRKAPNHSYGSTSRPVSSSSSRRRRVEWVLVLPEEAAREVPHAGVRLPGSGGSAGRGRRRPRRARRTPAPGSRRRRSRTPRTRHDRRRARPRRRSAGSAASRRRVPRRQYVRRCRSASTSSAASACSPSCPARRSASSPTGCAAIDRSRREVVREGDDGERFYVVLSGMLTVTQEALGERNGCSSRATTSARSR